MNTFKKVPLMALILGLGLMVTTMSFTDNLVLNTYYFDPSSNTWKPLTRIFDPTPGDEGYEPNSYRCENDPSKKCTGQFDSSATELPESAVPIGTIQTGIYTVNP